MTIQLTKLGLVFFMIILLLWLKQPLFQANLGGLVATILLYGIPPAQWVRLTAKVFTIWSSLSVLLSIYFITYLQRMLEARSQIKLAQQDLNGLFHNRRINAAGAPMFIGLLPSAAAMILCGDIVRDATEGYLKPQEQAFLSSWFRHIPESTLPTYTGVLLMASLSGVPLPEFMLGMIVPMLVLIVLGYISCLRKLPCDPGTPHSQQRGKDACNLFRHLWSLLVISLLILVFHLSVVFAVLVVIVLSALVYRFQPRELLPLVNSAWETKMLLNTTLVLMLKEFIAFTGVLQILPVALADLPIPMYLVFSLIFFAGALISGTSGIIALGTPLAFAAIPQAGMPLMVLLMCMCHAASQVSPTHVCLIVATEYFNITLGELVKKTLPLALLFCTLMIGYYQVLLLL